MFVIEALPQGPHLCLAKNVNSWRLDVTLR